MKLYQQLLELFETHPYHPFTFSDLIEELQLNESQTSKLEETIELLIEQKQAIQIGEHYFMSYDPRKWVIGHLHIKDGGYGFLVSDSSDSEDYYVPSYAFHHAHHYDRVLAFIKKLGFGRMEAEVVRVLEKSKRAIIGLFVGSSSSGFVIPDQLPGVKRILITSGHTLNAKDKQVVEVELYSNQLLQETMYGKVVTVLGYPDHLETERATLLRMHGFPLRFSKAVEDAVAEINPDELLEDDFSRVDYSDSMTCTIDPIDAKDFDDALSIEPTSQGWLVGVHIADVSHFVQVDTALDEEAKTRGTSVYLPQGVSPMLPERLSGDLCSLKPNEKRRAISVFFEFDQEGQVVKNWIERTWICSKRRFHYEEVQKIYDEYDKKSFPDEHWKSVLSSGLDDSWVSRLVGLRWFARLFRKERLSKGGIEFESTEVDVELDHRGKPISIRPRQHLESHRVIEEWMLLANRTVTEKFRSMTKKRTPFLYRIHEEPDETKLEEFLLMATDLGYQWTGGNPANSRDFQKYLQTLKTAPEAPILMDMAIRSMMRAHYSTVNIGHFGLGFSHYTHFTSPIRRYPDLIVHRLIVQYVLEKEKVSHSKKLLETLKNLARHCSEREQAATQAERDGIRWKQIEYYSAYVGKEFDAVIVAIQPRGIFVELIDTLTSCFIPCSDLSTEQFVFDLKRHTLRGRDSGLVYRLGDKIRVMIVKADEKNHKLTVTLTAVSSSMKTQKSAVRKASKKQSTNSRKSTIIHKKRKLKQVRKRKIGKRR